MPWSKHLELQWMNCERESKQVRTLHSSIRAIRKRGRSRTSCSRTRSGFRWITAISQIFQRTNQSLPTAPDQRSTLAPVWCRNFRSGVTRTSGLLRAASMHGERRTCRCKANAELRDGQSDTPMLHAGEIACLKEEARLLKAEIEVLKRQLAIERRCSATSSSRSAEWPSYLTRSLDMRSDRPSAQNQAFL